MIDYIVFPLSIIKEENQKKIEELSLVIRNSFETKKGIMKCQHFQEVFPDKVEVIVTYVDGEEVQQVVYPYETYSDEALRKLLATPEWSSQEEEIAPSDSSPVED